MSATISYPHLTNDPDGTVRIAGTRYKVRHLAAEQYFYGWSAEELLRQHPDLRPAEIYAALTYFHDHYDELVASIEQTASDHDRVPIAQALSREELLKRRAAQGA